MDIFAFWRKWLRHRKLNFEESLNDRRKKRRNNLFSWYLSTFMIFKLLLVIINIVNAILMLQCFLCIWPITSTNMASASSWINDCSVRFFYLQSYHPPLYTSAKTLQLLWTTPSNSPEAHTLQTLHPQLYLKYNSKSPIRAQQRGYPPSYFLYFHLCSELSQSLYPQCSSWYLFSAVRFCQGGRSVSWRFWLCSLRQF